jgi:hypothetical protein
LGPRYLADATSQLKVLDPFFTICGALTLCRQGLFAFLNQALGRRFDARLQKAHELLA